MTPDDLLGFDHFCAIDRDRIGRIGFAVLPVAAPGKDQIDREMNDHCIVAVGAPHDIFRTDDIDTMGHLWIKLTRLESTTACTVNDAGEAILFPQSLHRPVIFDITGDNPGALQRPHARLPYTNHSIAITTSKIMKRVVTGHTSDSGNQ